MAKKSKREEGLKHFFFHTRPGFYTLVLATIIGFTTTINTLNAANSQSVLGENSDREEQKLEEDKREEEKRKKEQRREEEKRKIEAKYEVDPEKLKLEYKYEDANAKIKRKVEIKDGEVEIEEELKKELADDLEESFEKVNETELASDSSSITIKKNKIKARTGFPLSIDVSTGQLTVTRPDGTTKNVAILPDKAVENFLRHKKVELIGLGPPDDGDDDGTGTESADQGFGIQSVDEVIEDETTDETEAENEEEVEVGIVEKNDELVYEIKGKRKVRILGFIPSQTSLTGYVSTETGDVVGEDVPLFDRFLNLISIQE